MDIVFDFCLRIALKSHLNNLVQRSSAAQVVDSVGREECSACLFATGIAAGWRGAHVYLVCPGFQ